MPVKVLKPVGTGDKTEIYNQTPPTGDHWDKNDETNVDYGATAVFSKFFGPPDPPVPNVT